MPGRERIEPNPGGKRYVRRDQDGQFSKDQTDVGKSSAADQRQHSATQVKKGRHKLVDQGPLPFILYRPDEPRAHLPCTGSHGTVMLR